MVVCLGMASGQQIVVYKEGHASMGGFAHLLCSMLIEIRSLDPLPEIHGGKS